MQCGIDVQYIPRFLKSTVRTSGECTYIFVLLDTVFLTGLHCCSEFVDSFTCVW